MKNIVISRLQGDMDFIFSCKCNISCIKNKSSVCILNVVPDPPINVRTSQVNANNATIKWSAPSNNKIRGVIKRYAVKVIQDNGDEIENKFVVDVTYCIVDYLLPNRNYNVSVAIENQRKQSLFSSVSFTTKSGENFDF